MSLPEFIFSLIPKDKMGSILTPCDTQNPPPPWGTRSCAFPLLLGQRRACVWREHMKYLPSE